MKRRLLTGALALALTATSVFAATTGMGEGKANYSRPAATQTPKAGTVGNNTAQTDKGAKKAHRQTKRRRHMARQHKAQETSMQTPAKKKGAR